METIRENAPFKASDLQDVVKKLKKYRSLMWNQAEKDGRQGYAIQYYEVVQTLIYGIYYTWEKYKYARGWLDGIAEEGEGMTEYLLFQIGAFDRIEALLKACQSNNIFVMFPEGQETNEMIILTFQDLLSNIRRGIIKVGKFESQSL